MRKKLYDIYPGITFSCSSCLFPDCKGYIYLLKDEVDTIVDNDIEVVCLNDNVYLLNNFDTKENGELRLDAFSPKCKLRCLSGLCSIQDIKPLVCLFYPITLEIYEDGNQYWAFHKSCQYYHDLISEGKKEEVVRNFIELLGSISEELLDNIIEAHTNC